MGADCNLVVCKFDGGSFMSKAESLLFIIPNAATMSL
jgi:hypothetical protein